MRYEDLEREFGAVLVQRAVDYVRHLRRPVTPFSLEEYEMVRRWLLGYCREVA